MALDEKLMKCDEAMIRGGRLEAGGVAPPKRDRRQVRAHWHDYRFGVTADRLNGESRRFRAYAHTARLLTSAVSRLRAAVVCWGRGCFEHRGANPHRTEKNESCNQNREAGFDCSLHYQELSRTYMHATGRKPIE